MNDESPPVAAVLKSDVFAPALTDLSSMSVIDVSGAEVESFLQGQFCNDLTLVKPAADELEGTAILNGYCTPKGRLLALPLVLATAGGLRLIVPQALEESLLKRLRMFVMRADVVFTPRPDLSLFGLQGQDEGWAEILTGELQLTAAPLTAELMGVRGDADTQALRWFDGEGGVARWILVLPQLKGDSFRDAVQGSDGITTLATEDQWLLGNIYAGVAQIAAATSDSFIPQMLNLQQVGGLSFTKGCYPGQEIVARMQYLGKLKRHMVHLALPAGARMPAPGEAIGTAESETAAEVVSSVDTGQGVHMLAVVRIGIELSALVVDGQHCSAIDLPYELPQPQQGTATKV